MTHDQELWGMALAMERKHGSEAPRVIAERIGKLTVEGETEGVNLWREVALRFSQLAVSEDSKRS